MQDDVQHEAVHVLASRPRFADLVRHRGKGKLHRKKSRTTYRNTKDVLISLYEKQVLGSTKFTHQSRTMMWPMSKAFLTTIHLNGRADLILSIR